MAATMIKSGRATTTTAPWFANWAQEAACRGLDLDFFFEDLQTSSRGSDPYSKAKEVCDSCDAAVRRCCLATSVAEGLRSGFFGGAIPARRIELRKAAQKAGVDVARPQDLAVFLADLGR